MSSDKAGNLMLIRSLAFLVFCAACVLGCSFPQSAQPRQKPAVSPSLPINRAVEPAGSPSGKPRMGEVAPKSCRPLVLASGEEEEQKKEENDQKEEPGTPPAPDEDPAEAEDEIPREPLIPDSPNPPDALFLPDVVASVHGTYPLIEEALQEITIARGNVLAAWGEFDLRLRGESQNAPLGFYQTYRNRVGFVQPAYHGGEVFGGYRIGRGNFEPWYLERETNKGGEFSAGVRVPLARNRPIDARRAQLWRASYDQQLAYPEIRARLLSFIREGSIAYWDWVASGRRYEINQAALELTEDRNEGIRRQVEEGDLDPPALRDNQRAIASRQAKLLDLERQLEQNAVRLSLFYRTPEGVPLIPDLDQLPNFPDPPPVDPQWEEEDIELALARRPELESLEIQRQRTQVDAAEAANDLLPNVDAQLIGSQDVGEPTSEKRDKSRFELEAGLFVDVPLQRRKGFGKLGVARGKLAQLAVRRRFTQDRIVTEIQSIYAAMVAAYDRVTKTREARREAEFLASVERRKLQLGETNLLAVFQREQIAIEAAEDEVNALRDYFIARAEYAAALAYDWVNEQAEPEPQ